MNKLNVWSVVKDGAKVGGANYWSVFCTVILYFLTVWIPYLNVGTTIAIQQLSVELAKGNRIKPTYIFAAKYRRRMGEFLVLEGIMLIAMIVGFFFGVIPMFVLSMAWGLASMLFVDKGLNALEALRESNNLTYGNKWRIFWAGMIVGLAICLLAGIAAGVCAALEYKVLGLVVEYILIFLLVPFAYGINAIIYRSLVLERETSEVE